MIIPFSYEYLDWLIAGPTVTLYNAAAYTLKSAQIFLRGASPCEFDGAPLFPLDPDGIHTPQLQGQGFFDPFLVYDLQSGITFGGAHPPPAGTIPFIDGVRTNTLLNFQNINVDLQGNLNLSYNPATYNTLTFLFSGSVEVV